MSSVRRQCARAGSRCPEGLGSEGAGQANGRNRRKMKWLFETELVELGGTNVAKQCQA